MSDNFAQVNLHKRCPNELRSRRVPATRFIFKMEVLTRRTLVKSTSGGYLIKNRPELNASSINEVNSNNNKDPIEKDTE